MKPTAANEIFHTADGGCLAYCEAGRGEPVVFLHGFGLDMSMWDSQWRLFSQRYRAIRYDLRGFGGSSLPSAPYSHAADFSALMSHLKARPAHLVGLSYGGRIALRIAVQQPAAVRTLTVVDTALDGYRWSEAYAQSWRSIGMTARKDVAEAKRQWLGHALFATARGRPEIARALTTMVSRYSGWHFHHTDPESGTPRAGAAELTAINAPTLVIVGERDLEDFQTIARLVAGTVPNASLKLIADSGHVPSLENVAAFNQQLLTHLQAATTTAPAVRAEALAAPPDPGGTARPRR